MRGVLAADEGTPTMIEIAKAIQEGAMAYLKRQFKTIAVILIPLAIVVFVTSTEVVEAADRGTERVVGPHVRPVRARSARWRSSPVACSRGSPGSSA